MKECKAIVPAEEGASSSDIAYKAVGISGTQGAIEVDAGNKVNGANVSVLNELSLTFKVWRYMIRGFFLTAQAKKVPDRSVDIGLIRHDSLPEGFTGGSHQ